MTTKEQNSIEKTLDIMQSPVPPSNVEIKILKPRLSSNKYVDKLVIKYYPITNTQKNYDKRESLFLLDEDAEYLMVFFNSLREHSSLSLIRSQLCIMSVLIVLLSLLSYINLQVCLAGFGGLILLYIFKGKIERILYSKYRNKLIDR